MTDSEWDIDVPEETSPPAGPKALREAYERQRQEAEQLRKDLASLNAKVRNQEIQAKLSSKGVPEKAWGLFPKDIDPTDEKVTEWVEQYGSLFAIPKEEARQDIPPTQEAPKVDEDQLKQIQAVTNGGAGGSSKEDFAAMLANPNLEKEVPFEKFLEALASQGANVNK